MTIYAVSMREDSALEGNGPSADAIRDALGRNRFPRSHWVGPAPRITRRVTTFSPTAGFNTYVTWLLDVDQVTYVPNIEQGIAEHVAGLLDSISTINRWTDPVVTPYNATTNGPLAWWQSGDAARTRTALEFPTGGGRFDANENPVGPDSPDLRPSTVPEGVNRWVDQSTGISLKTWVWLGLGAAGLYYLGGPIKALFSSSPARAPSIPRSRPSTRRALARRR